MDTPETATAANPGQAAQIGTIWKNSWPILGLMFLNFLVGYTDVYVAGLMGSDIQAAVGFISQQYFVLIILATALGVGTVAMVSQAAGAGDRNRVNSLAGQSFLLASALGAMLTFVSLTAGPAILDIFSLPDAVRTPAREYLSIYAAALFPNYMIIIAGAVFRAVGRAVDAFKIMALVTALNIAAAFGLVFGWGPLPRMGYRGIAWATVTSMSFGFCLVLLQLRAPRWNGVWRQRIWTPSREILLQLLKISWPAVLLQIAWNAGNVAIYQILGLPGEHATVNMAAYAGGLRLEAITYLPAFALNMAAAVLVGQSLGSGDTEQAGLTAAKMALGGAICIVPLAGTLMWIAPAVAGMLTDDPAVRAEMIRYLRINLMVAPLMVGSMVLGGGLQGAGDTRGAMAVIVVAIWIVRIPAAMALCFGLNMGALGVWIAMDLSMTVQTILMIRRFRSGAWRKKN